MGLIFSEGLSFSGFERNKVFVSRGDSTFADLSSVSGADSEGDCRAAVVTDIDDDGDPDLFVNAIQRDTHLLLRNNSEAAALGRFIKVKLRATKGHRDGIGAIVTVRRGNSRHSSVLSCGSGFESQHSLELIFGLGEDDNAGVTVQWPGRELESFGTIARGSRVTLTEGSGEATQRKAHTFSFDPPRPRGVRVREGEPFPGVSVQGGNGKPTAVVFPEAKKTVLNFWATTCVTCIREMPVFEKLHLEGNFNVVAISLDAADRQPVIDRIWGKSGFQLPAHRAAEASVEALFDVNTLSIPVTIVVNESGVIESIWQGAVNESYFK